MALASTCPACGRPVAVARSHCLYCGAALATEQVAAAERAVALVGAAPAVPARSERSLVILDAEGAAAEVLAAALALLPFEATLRARRGGYQLHRVAEPAAAALEAERLRAAGLHVQVVPEAEARAADRPWMALGGAWNEDTLALRDEEGAREVRASGLMLVVRGPISRTIEGVAQIKRVPVAGPQDGQRVHLYLLGEPRPIELDPEAFETERGTAAATTRLAAWLREVARSVPVDDAFARLTPALAPAVASAGGAAAAARALEVQQKKKDERGLVLDNVAQFRFYSGWRAAVERRRRAFGGSHRE
jgi:hypothetical protein